MNMLTTNNNNNDKINDEYSVLDKAGSAKVLESMCEEIFQK